MQKAYTSYCKCTHYNYKALCTECLFFGINYQFDLIISSIFYNSKNRLHVTRTYYLSKVTNVMIP